MYAQNITTSFQTLSDEAMNLGLNQKQKKEVSKILKNTTGLDDTFKSQTKNKVGFSYFADVQNESLNLVGNMEESFEMCFWKYST